MIEKPTNKEKCVASLSITTDGKDKTRLLIANNLQKNVEQIQSKGKSAKKEEKV